MLCIVGEKTVLLEVLLLKFTALSLLQNNQIKKAIAMVFVMWQYKKMRHSTEEKWFRKNLVTSM